MKIKKIDITEIDGFRIGNAEDTEAGTGVTAIIAEKGAVAGVDVRGGGPATRETDLLRSENTVDKVHAVVLSGGSAFGLEAASGVMRALASRGIGFQLDRDIYVPIVPAASLYDLPVGRSDVFPDVEMGKQAVENAYTGTFSAGNHGAGTGATVGKYLGYERAMKTGIGTFACGDDYVQVGAIAAVNAVGDIYNGAGNIIAGLRNTDGTAIKGTIRILKGMVHDESSPDLDLTDIRTIAASEALRNERSNTEEAHASEPESPADTASSSADRSDIVKAMMASYNQEKSATVEDEYLQIENVQAAEKEPAELQQETGSDVSVDAAPEELVPAAHAGSDFDAPEEVAEISAPEESSLDAADEEDPEQSAEYTAESQDSPEDNKEEAAAAQEPVHDEFVLSEEDKADMGYDIPFNTVISCLITNARMTKPQANKLASILHDAYARAIKPSHGTLDGDTIFVMSTCTQDVNFDAFAALATDVLQYAVIDGAQSAEGAYGLPAARDIIRK